MFAIGGLQQRSGIDCSHTGAVFVWKLRVELRPKKSHNISIGDLIGTRRTIQDNSNLVWCLKSGQILQQPLGSPYGREIRRENNDDGRTVSDDDLCLVFLEIGRKIHYDVFERPLCNV